MGDRIHGLKVGDVVSGYASLEALEEDKQPWDHWRIDYIKRDSDNTYSIKATGLNTGTRISDLFEADLAVSVVEAIPTQKKLSWSDHITLGEIKDAVDKAWNSSTIVAQRDRAGAVLDKVAQLSPEKQHEYWEGVRQRMRDAIARKKQKL